MEQVEQTNDVEAAAPIIKTWDDIPNLDPRILRGIFAYGFEHPSPIQAQAIVPLMQGRDVVAQAQSGTGKTAAFVIGALSQINTAERATQVLIISPTKELTTQTARVVAEIGQHLPDLVVDVMYGGMPLPMRRGQMTPHVVCGCPGRVYDMIMKGVIQAQKVRLIILDEADELLSVKFRDGGGGGGGPTEGNLGFKDQIYNIFQQLSPTVQVGLFTATVPLYMEKLVAKMMRTPVVINVAPEKLTLEGIKQYYVTLYNDFDKVGMLKSIYNRAAVSQSIIYCNSVKRVVDLYNVLHKEGFPICCIHSNMDKNIRDIAFREFIGGKHRIMISSDLTSRGIDIQQVSMVINYDIPSSKYTYLHRIGRSGRWGRKGVGINFVTQRDVGILREIEEYYQCEVEVLPAELGGPVAAAR